MPIFRNEEIRWAIVAEDAQGNELRDVRVVHLDKRSRDQNYVVQAERAEWTGREWKFYEMRKVLLDPQDQAEPVISVLREGTLPEFKLSPDDLALKNQALEDMNAEQLRQAIAALRVGGGELNKRDLGIRIFSVLSMARSATRSLARKMPLWCRSASTSVVLPWST